MEYGVRTVVLSVSGCCQIESQCCKNPCCLLQLHFDVHDSYFATKEIIGTAGLASPKAAKEAELTCSTKNLNW